MRTFWLPLFLSLLLCLGATPLIGQATTQQDGPYFLSAKRDILYGGAAGGTVAFGHLLRGRTPDIVLADLRLGNIPPFDCIATKFSSEAARTYSDYALYASAGLPVLLLAGRESRRDVGKIGVLFSETLLLNQGMTDIIKSTANARARTSSTRTWIPLPSFAAMTGRPSCRATRAVPPPRDSSSPGSLATTIPTPA